MSGALQDTGAISFGADASGDFATVAGAGAISVGAGADVTFGGDVTGAAGLAIAAGATVTVDAKLSGLSGATLAAKATIDFADGATTVGTDVNVPISLAGSDVIGVQDGVAVDGAVSGFDVTDAILDSGLPLEEGGAIVTAAALSGSGVLGLTKDGAQNASVQLAGGSAGRSFLTAGVGQGLADGDSVIGLAGPAVAAPSGGAVAGGGGLTFQVLTGSGSGSGLSLTGNNAVTGSESTDDLTVGGAAAGTLNTLLIEAGAKVSASGTADVQASAEADGAAAALDVGGVLTLGGGPGEAQLAAVNGALVQLGGLDVTGYSGAFDATVDGAQIILDPAGAIEVGSAGGAAAGALTIDAGRVATSRTLNALLVGDVVDEGTLEVAAPANPDVFESSLEVSGGVSGPGALLVDAATQLSAFGDVSGIGSFAIGAGSGLEIDGSLSSKAALTTGAQSGVVVGRTIGGLAALDIGAGGSLNVGGAATGLGSITIGQTARATFLSDLSGTGTMVVGSGGTVSVSGTLSGLSQVTLDPQLASLELFGADAGVGVAFGGGDTLTVGAGVSATGALTGFDGTDAIMIQAAEAAVDGGEIVTGATYAAGRLTLTDDGAVLNTLTLAGAYTAGEFLANAVVVNDATGGASDVTIAGPATTIQAGTVVGGTGLVFDVLSGAAVSPGSLTFLDNVAAEGAFTAAGVTVGGADAAGAVPALDIEAGASVTSTQAAAILTGAEVDGAGAKLTAASLAVGGGSGDAELFVVDGGAVQTGALSLTSGTGSILEPSDTLFVDPLGTVQVGAGAAAQAGAVVIAAGATLSADASGAGVDAAVVDDGTVSVTALPGGDGLPDTLHLNGAVTGTGAISVAASQNVDLADASGLADITIGAHSSLLAAGLSNIGTLVAGASSTATIDGDVSGSGGVTTGAGSALEIFGALSGPGALVIGAGASATIDGTVSGLSGITLEAGATLDLGGDEAGAPIVMGQGTMLQILPGASITGVISGFATGDVIKVFDDDDAKIVTTAVDSSGTLSLSDDGTLLTRLTLAGGYAGQQFIANAAGDGGYSDVVLADVPCFAAGVRILTERGEVAVERLEVGDPVVVLDGAGRALLPVRWIGRRRIDLARHPSPQDVQPILVRRDAIGEGAPHRDLLVSPDHALFVDGALIPARLLVNGGSVARVGHLAEVWYFHVELERHAVLIADGMPAESYLDTGNRAMFAGGGGTAPLVADFADGPGRAERSCAELLLAPERTEPVWRKVAARSSASGRPVAPPAVTRDACPRLVAGPLWIAPARGGEPGRLVFPVPAGARRLRLTSRAAAPSDAAPWHDDRRRLGVFVAGLSFVTSSGRLDVSLDDPGLSHGWHGVERAGGAMRRWTDGDASIPAPPDATSLVVEVADTASYLAPAPAPLSARRRAGDAALPSHGGGSRLRLAHA